MEESNIELYQDEILKALKEISIEEGLHVAEDEVESRNLSSAKIKKKYKNVIDKLFTKTSEDAEELFNLSYGIIDKFNISPESFVMCLNRQNRQKLRGFASNNCNANYYQKKEYERTLKRQKKKSINVNGYENIRDLFK
jgi:hypothetical protein